MSSLVRLMHFSHKALEGKRTPRELCVVSIWIFYVLLYEMLANAADKYHFGGDLRVELAL